MIDDKHIVDLLWKRDSSALKLLSDKYGKMFMSMALRILKTKEDSEECVNDAYVDTWNSIPDAKPYSLFAYVGKIVRNRSIDRLKNITAQKRGNGNASLIFTELQECIESNETVIDKVEEKELSRYISEFLCSLKKQDRILFLERYWCAMTVKEIAGIHNFSYKKVESILYRCRKSLKKYLNERGYYL